MAALANGLVLVAPASARPPICTEWAWHNCDPIYPRGTAEWGECFDYYSTLGCPWWDGSLTGKKSPPAVKLEDMQALLRQ
jgi:hypothetical protein